MAINTIAINPRPAAVKYWYFLSILIVIIMLSILGGAFNKAHGAPVVGFIAGRIIDDDIFTNTGTMNVDQVQNFLNSKVSLCDTGGTLPAAEFGRPDLTHAQYASAMGWSAPPYTCLKDYTENSLSSAQIIYNLSQQYKINPQVLVVLLQKEQGLVTDTWPLSTQYKTATGYGCPDTAVCDAQYFGFTNQATWSAKMFRAIMDNNPNWYTPYILGDNYIRWNPNSVCGGSTVNIQNRSTQALYNYTPYQPNQSALNAGYGMGDSCGAYGNRNFYQYFVDWFGSTLLDCSPSEPTLSQVQRLYNPTTYEHFYAIYQCEVNVLTQKNGFNLVGSAFNSTLATETWAIPVYRLYNTARQLHFWTTSTSESDTLQSLGFQYEGITFHTLNPTNSGAYPVYRIYNPATQVHLWTLSLVEADNANRYGGYRYEGPAFYSQ